MAAGGFLVQFPVALIELKEGSVTGGNVFYSLPHSLCLSEELVIF